MAWVTVQLTTCPTSWSLAPPKPATTAETCLAALEAFAGEDTLAAPLDQTRIVANHHLHGPVRAVLTLKRLQLAGQLVVGLQVAVIGAQALNLAVTLEAIEQAVA